MIEYRPWGYYEILLETEDVKVKRIVVNPGQQTSYQYHEYRSEFWTVVSGVAEIILEDELYQLDSYDYITIPQGAKHRVKNPIHEKLIFIEVQTGTYFGEDDIIRIQDDYGRE